MRRELSISMNIEVRVKPRAKQTSVEEGEGGVWTVKVKEPAEDGRANEAVIEAIARHFKVPKRHVAILRGQSSRTKVIQIK